MIHQARRSFFILGIFILAAMASCATVPELSVNYQLPQESDELSGKKILVGFEDKRTSKDLLGTGAKKEYKNFSENISFSVARYQETGFKIGIYEVPALFKEVLKRRLENLGAEVVAERQDAQVEIVLVLKKFLLDLDNRKWKAFMDYEAKLKKDGDELVSQMISGEAERLKTVGHGAADKVMSELFTDTVNRLDIRRLFERSKLL